MLPSLKVYGLNIKMLHCRDDSRGIFVFQRKTLTKLQYISYNYVIYYSI